MEKAINNKELFKLKIIEQFSKNNSEISNLFNRKFTVVNFAREKRFLCSEFDLCVDVERLKKEGRFQVTFTELCNLSSTLPKNIIDLSNNKSLAKVKHIFERMRFVEETIYFFLDRVELLQEDYQFYLNNEGAIQETMIGFDLKTGKLILSQCGSVKDFLNLITGYGTINTLRRELVPTESQIQWILDTKWFNLLKPSAKEEIRTVLNKAICKDGNGWFLFEFIVALDKFGSDLIDMNSNEVTQC